MSKSRSDLLQGTLELLILKILSLEPMHGWGISERIQRWSDEVFLVNQGSLYPALQRMKRKGWISSAVESDGKQPKGSLLRPHVGGGEAVGRGESGLGPVLSGRGEDPSSRIRSLVGEELMGWFRPLRERLGALLDRGRLDAEMEEELRFHLEQETEKNVGAGMTPGEARRRAMIAFGGVERFKEKTREERGVRPVEDLLRDLKLAMRTLRRAPGVVVVTVLSLGLGIAASATVFSMANALVLGDPGPIRDPESIITVYSSDAGGRPYGETSFPDYLDIQAGMETVEDLTALRIGVVAVGDPADRDRIIVELVTGNYFQVMGVSPVPGSWAFFPRRRFREAPSGCSS